MNLKETVCRYLTVVDFVRYLLSPLRKIKHAYVNRIKRNRALANKEFVPNINFSFTEKQRKILLSYSTCSFSY
ncbi:MAG: hypothetical protein LUE99_00145, partial [Bacteroides sp.]|nr:hypothetical protein [Bacteroides sp.]